MRIIILLLCCCFALASQAQNVDCKDCWWRTEMYFGLSKPNGGKVSKRQWKNFVTNQITPAFPDGSTILTAKGQWKDSKTGETISESSRVVILLYPQSDKETKDEALQKIADSYKKQFDQQSVMRVDALVEITFY